LDTIALDAEGNVWSWGYYWSTIRRNGDYARPAKVPDVSNIKAIAKGSYFALALRLDGTVVSWGHTDSGQVGNGTFTPDDLNNYVGPTSVAGLKNIVAISAGQAHGLALDASGKVYGWGDNQSQQLGFISNTANTQSGRTAEPVPMLLPVPGKAVAVNADVHKSQILLEDGRAVVFNANPSVNSVYAQAPKPIALLPISYQTTADYFMDRDGLVYSAASSSYKASNYYGQFGDGTIAQRLSIGLVVNSTADAYLNLLPSNSAQVPLGLQVPFFVVASGGITDTSASVTTTTKFNPSDTGKSGSVFVTAMVPSGSLGATTIGDSPPNRVFAATPQALASTATCPTTVNPLTLVQLTPTGWKTVVNGQLIPYASGVLGDQLAAQTILNGTDTTNLKGAEFCVGYGTSAQDMVNNGNIRAVATIPGATTTSTCVVGSTISVGLNVAPGWNLLGNPINQSITVVSKFGDTSKVNSVWKWDTSKANWQFYSPGLDAAALQSYVTSKGYGVLTEISPGDGYWVHAKVQADLGSMCGSSINLRQSSLSSGWNLVSTASPISAKEFNLTLSTTPPTAGQVPINMTSLWAWDANQTNWYFYAPSLDAQGGSVLSEYISSKTYKDFTSNGKTLGNGVGIWVNRP
jgi:alpha-tubulin suppressor-like RCC1 family protein